jgi:hypothetical protein
MAALGSAKICELSHPEPPRALTVVKNGSAKAYTSLFTTINAAHTRATASAGTKTMLALNTARFTNPTAGAPPPRSKSARDKVGCQSSRKPRLRIDVLPLKQYAARSTQS